AEVWKTSMLSSANKSLCTGMELQRRRKPNSSRLPYKMRRTNVVIPLLEIRRILCSRRKFRESRL
ncbi:hypothetical protein LTR23_011010, partial [Exophiala sp. CCFEE 6169]